MPILTVAIDDITPIDETTAVVNFRWAALDIGRGRSMNDSGSMLVRVDTTSSVVNQSVIDESVRLAAGHGVVVGETDRKLLLAGLA